MAAAPVFPQRCVVQSDREGTTEVDIGALLDHQRPAWFHRRLLGMSLLLMLFEGYDMQVLAFAAPVISRDWGIARGDLGPVFGAGLLGYMIGATCLTALADRYGRRIVITGGTLLFGAMTLASILANSIPQLLALRFVAGIGLGASIPVLMALNIEYAPARLRGSRVTLLYVGYCLGGLFGGMLAARLMPAYGWQSVFIVGGVVPLVLGVALHAALPESVRLLVIRGRRSEEMLGILRRLFPERHFTGAETFVLSEKSAPGAPLRQLFTGGRRGMTLTLWLACIMGLLGHHLITAWLPTVLEAAGVPLSMAVTAGAVMMGGAAVGCILCGWLLDRWGMLSVMGLFLLSVPIVIATGLPSLPPVTLMVLVFLAGATLLAGQVGLHAVAGTVYPTYIRSSGAGWALGVGRIGSIIGPVAGGLLIAGRVSAASLFVYASIPGVLCAAFIWMLWMIVRSRGGGSSRSGATGERSKPLHEYADA